MISTLIVAYLVATLSTTGLAKLANLSTVQVGLLRERIVPAGAVAVVAAGVSLVELVIAGLLVLRVLRVELLVGLAALFVLFALYHVAVGVKTRTVMCSCAGELRSGPGSLAAIAGSTLSCVVLAALAVAAATTNPSPGALAGAVVAVAFATPFAVLFAAMTSRALRPSADDVGQHELAGDSSSADDGAMRRDHLRGAAGSQQPA
jgi:hypothetical protein